MNTVTDVNEWPPQPAEIRLQPGVVRNRIDAMLEAGHTLRRIAAETGLSLSDIKAWLKWDASDEVEKVLVDLLTELEQAASKSEPGWFETPTSTRFLGGFEQARSDPSIFIGCAASGCGKTTAKIHYAETQQDIRTGRNAVFYVNGHPAIRTLPAVLDSLAGVIGAGGGHAYRTSELYEAIARRLHEGDLIIFDEAQHLDYTAIEGLRGLLDDRGIGLAFLGNEKTFKDFSGSGRAAKFAQISSRVGIRLMVTHPTEGDIDAMLGAWGVKGRSEREFMQVVGQTDGALRKVHRVIKQARGMGGVEILFLKSAAKYIGLDVQL